MRITSKILICIFALISIFSCNKRELENVPSGPDITLKFICDDLTTKAGTHGTMPGEDDIYNENLISTIDYFFFPKGKTGLPAVLHGRVVVNAVNTTTITIPVTDAFVREILFSQSNGIRTCEVFAVANYPTVLQDDLTLPQLLNLPVSFGDNFGQLGNSNLSSFVMASSKASKIGSETVTLQSWGKTTSATANVHLKRIASKITLAIRVENQVTLSSTLQSGSETDVRNEIWRPMLGELRAYLVNGAKNTLLNGLPVDEHTPFSYAPDGRRMTNVKETRQYITYQWSGTGDDSVLEQVTKTGEFSVMEPFYTYPLKWEWNSDKEPYFKISIPWVRDAGTSSLGNNYGTIQKQYFYKLITPGQSFIDEHGDHIPNISTLSGNAWYKIYLNVAILGSEFDEVSLEITGSYYVVDWQESETNHGSGDEETEIDTDKEADIRGARYLSVPQNNYVMYNTDRLSIKYTTSDPCKIVNASVKYKTYYSTAYNYDGTPEPVILSPDKYSILLENGHIVFTHALNNFGDADDSEYDISEFDINFTIQHSDNAEYHKNITIKQYPAIMIYAQKSTHKDYYYNNVDRGYVFVNNGNPSYGSDPQKPSPRSNNNFNMYVIETTVLSENSTYMLGDPRSSVDNLGSSWSTYAYSVTGEYRRLSYYRPASQDASANNVIAPKFRIASSYGATIALSFDDAFKRCASYQEDGYPAGRWRVPTKAEIEYMAQLNTDNKIPRLLGSETGGYDSWSYYWCNSGSVAVGNGSNTRKPQYYPNTGASQTYVRCVYDEWYWSNTQYVELTNKNTFTWGDLQ